MAIYDDVWFIATRQNNEKRGIFYSPPGTSAQEAWAKAFAWDMVQGLSDPHTATTDEVRHWMADMRKRGWRARKLKVVG